MLSYSGPRIHLGFGLTIGCASEFWQIFKVVVGLSNEVLTTQIRGNQVILAFNVNSIDLFEDGDINSHLRFVAHHIFNFDVSIVENNVIAKVAFKCDLFFSAILFLRLKWIPSEVT